MLTTEWVLGGSKSNEFKKLQNNYNNLQTKFIEEKQKTFNWENNLLKEFEKVWGFYLNKINFLNFRKLKQLILTIKIKLKK